MKVLLFMLLTITATLSLPALSESLSEISIFAKEICDQFDAEGNITREKLQGKLEGNVAGVARLLGASVGADGEIQVDNTTYKGLPFENVSGQMTDSRDCRKQLAKMLLEERKQLALSEKAPSTSSKSETIIQGVKHFSLADDETTFLLDGKHWLTFEHGRTANAGCIRVVLDGIKKLHCVGKILSITDNDHNCGIIYLGTDDKGATANFALQCKES